MSRLVVLSLGQGNLRDGFATVTAQIGEASNSYQMKINASLPAAPKILELYQNWQALYYAFYQRLSCWRTSLETDDYLEISEVGLTHVSEVDIAKLSQKLSKRLNTWLDSREFRKIDRQLRTQLKPSDEIRFIIETNDPLLRRLPWHLWEFFEDYPYGEVALSATEYQNSNKFPINHRKFQLKILAIFGNAQGIDISHDRIFLEKLTHRAEIKFLVEPNLRDLNDHLWQEGWDILFFAGHSSSQDEGILQINPTDTISLEKLRYALKEAMGRGLKLAIFNSCDGLGLAQQLEDLNIPQAIVMREAVPDVVAQQFLRYFITEFSSGKSLYAAVRSARERLQALEKEYPCATWLPIIFQNPAEPSIVWLQDGIRIEWEDMVSSPTLTPSFNLRGMQPEMRSPVATQVFSQPINVHQDLLPPYPSGSVPLDSPYYVENTVVSAQVCREITKPGALIRIKAPMSMGKTSLLSRILEYASCIGYRTISLNLEEQIDREILSDLNRFLRWLCANISRQLQIAPQLDDYWDEDIGSKVSCSHYLRNYILEQIDSPVVLALDEVNQIFEHPQVAKEFLPLLRSWYEEAKRRPIWQKLRLIVVHSTEVYVPLQFHQSPFNVGLPIQLKGFSFEQVQQLALCYGLCWKDGLEVELLMEMVGGHPALVHLALYHLSQQQITLAQLLRSASTSTSIYYHHLQRHWEILKAQPELASALRTVINATEAVQLESVVAYKLSSMGLIKLDNNKVTPSCQLYREYFQSKFPLFK
ncbi:CHAT domain-containing protein [Scytonema sp. UIC 10036]|uniref:AAA-like domain-containing protein n=1 Tax=Scytonema sp. UIC 10036 TaxID=2304196 RepID=UPI0012DA2F37|nr:AAA-like domain-containing protein [Scytonema sp. UIC 10036]MUG95678.1 CHAT domain-containing protein [Scytonema sp. UIC 10036]